MPRAILTILTWASALIAAAVLAAWALGRAVTDRWGWSQFLWWIPSPVAVVLVAAELLLASGFAAWARRWGAAADPAKADARPSRGRAPARKTRVVLWLTWGAASLFMLLGEWRAGRYLTPVRPVPGRTSVRVLFWNSEVERLANFESRVGEQEPDIAVVANAPQNADWQALRRAMGRTDALRTARFSLVSKLPVRRWGFTDLDIPGVRPRVNVWKGGGNIVRDTGQAMFLELESAELGGPVVVWVLDLPSDPTLARREMLKQAAGQIASFEGPVMVRGQDGMDRAEAPGTRGFPTPDLVLGDFNTPRGSWSLGLIVGDMAAAFDQAGRGFAATWPRRFPVIAIDQAFVGPRLRAAGYRVVDMGAALHRAEVVELVAGDR